MDSRVREVLEPFAEEYHRARFAFPQCPDDFAITFPLSALKAAAALAERLREQKGEGEALMFVDAPQDTTNALRAALMFVDTPQDISGRAMIENARNQIDVAAQLLSDLDAGERVEWTQEPVTEGGVYWVAIRVCGDNYITKTTYLVSGHVVTSGYVYRSASPISRCTPPAPPKGGWE